MLEVIYLVFNEGYSATAGDDWVRPALCEDALRLGRVLAELAPGEPEVHGLVALMEIQASRLRARVGPSGEPILLLDQDRARWDRVLIGRGLAALERGGAAGRRARAPTRCRRAIAACHARARHRRGDRLDAHRGALRRARPARALARRRAEPRGGRRDGVRARGRAGDRGRAGAGGLAGAYHLLPSVRGDFLVKLGRRDEARVEFERAAGLTQNARERGLLLDRAAACELPQAPGPAT